MDAYLQKYVLNEVAETPHHILKEYCIHFNAHCGMFSVTNFTELEFDSSIDDNVSTKCSCFGQREILLPSVTGSRNTMNVTLDCRKYNVCHNKVSILSC